MIPFNELARTGVALANIPPPALDAPNAMQTAWRDHEAAKYHNSIAPKAAACVALLVTAGFVGHRLLNRKP